MKLNKVYSVEIVSKDIHILRDLLYKAKDRVGSMHDPLVNKISQLLGINKEN